MLEMIGMHTSVSHCFQGVVSGKPLCNGLLDSTQTHLVTGVLCHWSDDLEKERDVTDA